MCMFEFKISQHNPINTLYTENALMVIKENKQRSL